MTSSAVPATPTVPADVPLIGHNMLAGEKPPVEPLAALAHTSDGAIAFAKFWVRTMDWGYATTSTTYARHYVDPACVTCLQILTQIDQVASSNQHYLGDRITISDASIAGGIDQQHGSEYVVLVLTDVTGAQVVDAQNKFVRGAAAITGRPVRLWLRWIGSNWTVVDFGGA